MGTPVSINLTLPSSKPFINVSKRSLAVVLISVISSPPHSLTPWASRYLVKKWEGKHFPSCCLLGSSGEIKSSKDQNVVYRALHCISDGVA